MVRSTRQRDAIRAAFQRADRPLSPSEALTLATEEVPALGISTVYRTIAALVEEGWLKTVSLPGQPDRYETAGRHHHHHFHCTLCGGVFEVEACPGDFGAMAPKGFQVHDHEVILTGWCKACARVARRGAGASGGGSPGAGVGPRAGEDAARRAMQAHVHVAGCLQDGCDTHASPRSEARAGASSRAARRKPAG